MIASKIISNWKHSRSLKRRENEWLESLVLAFLEKRKYKLVSRVDIINFLYFNKKLIKPGELRPVIKRLRRKGYKINFIWHTPKKYSVVYEGHMREE